MKKTILFFLSISFLAILFSNIYSVKADEYFDVYYGTISWEDEQIHLDNFSIFLKRNPEYNGYIAFFVGEKEKLKTIEKRVERAKKYLIEFRKIPQDQVIIVNAGKDKKTKIILQPVSKNNPPPEFGCD